MSTQTTPEQQQTLGDTSTEWSQTITFAQFDPSQGTLQGIDVGLTADVTGSVVIESLEAAPSSVTVSLPGAVTLSGPGNVWLGTAAFDPTASASLAASDGTLDFGGASGTTLSGIAATGTAAVSLQAGAGSVDLSPFVGTGAVPLGVNATVGLHLTGPANMQIAAQASAGASVSLLYDYIPPPGGSQGSAGSVTTSLIDVGLPLWFTNAITTAPQVFTIADSTTGWLHDLDVAQFDPSLGTLASINITVSGNIVASVSVENGNTGAASLTTTQTAAFSLDLPGTTETTVASVGDSMLLGGYDGTQDFGGASGHIDQSLTQTSSIAATASDATDLTAFTGSGSVSVPLGATGSASLDGPANLWAKLAADAGATVSVSYTYIAPQAELSLASSVGTITSPLVIANGSTYNATGLAISDASGNGSVTVSGTGSTIVNDGVFTVGSSGYGFLLITSGGLVQTSGGATAIAGSAGTDGSNVSVNGTGSTWQIAGALDVGDGATGSMSISAGGTVTAGQTDIGALTGDAGIVSVVGTGSNLSAGTTLIVGDAASAELSILSGGMVSATNADLGVQAGSSGNVDIEGAGSHLDIANDLNIGGAGVGVLTLGNGTELTVGNNLVIGANGVLNQFGGSIDPSTITIVSGGRQGGHGTSTASVMISNAGTLFASAGTETVITPLITAPSGKSGVLEIDTGGNLLLNVTSVEANQSVTFTDSTGILTIGTIGGFAAPIVGVIAGDTIIVQGKSIASDSFNASTHVLTLFDGSSATIGTLQLGPSVDGSAILANGTGGLGVAPCFAAGTRISTERGEVPVEDLRVGDRAQIVGSAPSQPVTWIGHRSVDCTRHPKPQQVWPVRVCAHAFGPNRPCRDLYLSPDHALFVVDALIPVKHLINGTTITQVPRDQVTYYHVELPRHEVVLAEGLPAESYLDTGDRTNFANGGSPVALYPDFATRTWEARACAPLLVTGPALDAVRRWLSGFARSENRASA